MEENFRVSTRRLQILVPKDFKVTNYPKTPLACFNPGAVVRDEELLLFPRLVFDYFDYNSSIGVTKIPIKEVVRGEIKTPLETEIIIYPTRAWERASDKVFGRGCEDPRVYDSGNRFYILYTGASSKGEIPFAYQAVAELDSELRVKSKYVLKLENVRCSMKNGTILSLENRSGYIAIRPQERLACYTGKLDLEKRNIYDLRVQIIPSPSEFKVGWSTNALKVGEKFLIGWHVKSVNHLYKQSLAILGKEGVLESVSRPFLIPRGFETQYGDRSGVIYGCGLVEWKDRFYWIGGIGDYSIGVWRLKLGGKPTGRT